MRQAILTVLLVGVVFAQADRDFSGDWKLNTGRSQIRDLPWPPEPFLKIELSGSTLRFSSSAPGAGASDTWSYSLDGKVTKHSFGDAAMSTVTKWEGSALLVNTLVSGPRNYTLMERWKLSRDRRTLTVRKTVLRLGSETESELVYENPSLQTAIPNQQPAPTAARATAIQPPATQSAPPSEYVVTSGTRILLSLVNSVNTKHASAGDRVYLQTATPVYSQGRLVIPRGSYVTGTVTEAQRSGRVKGKPSIQLRFDSLTLPNGTMRDFRSRPGSVDGKGDVSRHEGTIRGEGNKGGDARTVGETTAAGTSVGAIAGGAAGHLGVGAAIGAAAGAGAGLIGVLASRGPEMILPQGSTMEMVLDRELKFTDAELR